METLSRNVALLAIRRGWLQAEQYEWCLYTLIKYTGTVLFFIVVIVASFLLRKISETMVFVLVTYLLRRRIGGCHAKTVLQCQFMSFGITGFNVLVVCPAIRHIFSENVIFFVSLVIAYILLVTRPVYPERLHFSEEIKEKNNIRKNILILVTAILLIVSYIALPELLPSFLTGLLVVLIGAAVEINTLQYGGKENDKT